MAAHSKPAGRLRRRGLWVVLSLAMGCSLHTPFWRLDRQAPIPPGALPAPPGTYVRLQRETYAAAAEQDDFVIYRHEWFQDGIEPGPYGSYHLNEIVRRLPHVPFPILVQPDHRPDVNEMRRQVVVQYLAAHGTPEPDRRVLVAFPQAGGLSGEEAATTYYEMLGREALQGAPDSMGTVGGIGTGIGGFGGGVGFGGY